ncbi:TetR family transcriptional regulator [Gordonia desulfuricans]|uniref:TetR family transcriptional regulator n=1 Tax=Gordonia desulfuricans TaxID=89051 RepID=A0A7K3LRX4_9ACTN|nr:MULTISPECIES: TetR family transcriptional regulator [Gordonia]KOY49199.1 TetR family transcriptional regulator [Gordonia sp. NB41Y]NDK90846.1 TetR family transcriptional regulator [Gordonia desulfuricans]WLP91982.1 TetR family transcriptional regulator [Gordonia sp. NB41Y]
MSVTERRAALVESAYRVIADHGVEGATTRRICAHADMPLASFHYAFESRTALLGAVMETAVPSDIDQMLAAILPTGDLDEGADLEVMEANMRRQLQAFLSMLKADPGRLQATISLGIYAHNHPELQRYGQRMYENLYAVAAKGLDAAAQHAGVRWTQPTSEIAPVLIGTLISVTLIYLSTADDHVMQLLVESLVRQTMSHAADA